MLRTKERRKEASHLRVVAARADGAERALELDFMRNTFDDDRPLRILTVVAPHISGGSFHFGKPQRKQRSEKGLDTNPRM